jgi:cell shape-determining protein MreD
MIVFAFLLSLLPFALQIFIYGPSLPILPFIPFIAFSLLLQSLPKTLFLSALCGLLVDFISADPFGIHTLNHAATSAFCFRGKSFFSAESPLQYSLYTAICSFVSTNFQIALLFLFDRRVSFQGTWWLTEWTMLPVFDALYAFIWFAGPIAAFRMIQRFGAIYWLKRKKSFQS